MLATLSLPVRAVLFNRLWLLHLAFVLIACRAWTQEYTVTDLGTLGGSASSSNGVNNAGQVIGSANIAGNSHADPFLYSKGKMVDAWAGGTQFGGTTVAINNSGHYVVNYNMNTTGTTESYLFGVGRGVYLGTGFAVGMNNNDEVFGVRPNPLAYPAYPANSNGYWVYIDGKLNMHPAYPISEVNDAVWFSPFAINDEGMIVGDCWNATVDSYPDACAAESSEAHILTETGGGEFPTAMGVKDNSQACGLDWNHDLIVWDAEGNVAGDTSVYVSGCAGLDDYGTAVGDTTIYNSVNGVRDLNALIPRIHIRGRAAKVDGATGIADTGYISANCDFTAEGKTLTHACVLTPQWPAIMKDEVNGLAKGDPECIQCVQELEPEANSLPAEPATASTEKKTAAIATLKKMQTQLATLWSAGSISQPALLLLDHDIQMTLAAFGYLRK